MSNETTFYRNEAQSGGPLNGDYLWSDANNWSAGRPVSGDSVSESATGVDDIASLSLSGLALTNAGNVEVTGSSLTVDALSGSSGSLYADALLGGAPVTVTIDADSSRNLYMGAIGDGARFIDNAASDAGAGIYASNGGLVEFTKTPDSSAAVLYEKGGTVAFKAPAASNAIEIANIQPGTVLELPGTAVDSVSFGSGTLDVTTNAGTYDFTNVYYSNTPGGYTSSVDSSTGLEAITFTNAACYASGTKILGADGQSRAIQALRVGDEVATLFGKTRSVVWLGFRRVDCTRHPDPAAVWPFRIRAGAFAEQQPERDLWVSPGHGIYLHGVLIQAERLVNGATIVQEPVERVDYWHVELDQHDIIFAEGMASESYLDTGNRGAFINGGAFVEAHPDFRPKHWTETCVPLIMEGDQLQSAKSATLARARFLGYETTNEAGMYILADGTSIHPIQLSVTRFAFLVPEMRTRIELRSRCFVPAHIEAASNDTRSLGVCIGRLQLDGAEIPLDDEAAFSVGWHSLECESGGYQWRWSHDCVPLPSGTRLVVVDIRLPGSYWVTSATRLSSHTDKAVAT